MNNIMKKMKSMEMVFKTIKAVFVLIFLSLSLASAEGTGFPIATTPAGPGDNGKAGREMSISSAFDGTNFLVGVQGAAKHDSILPSLFISPEAWLALADYYGPYRRCAICFFDGTNYLMVWEDCGEYTVPACQDDLWGQFVSKSGSLVGSAFAITPPSTNLDGGIVFGGGNYLLVYSPEVDGNRIVNGRIISPSGDVGNEFRISTGLADKGFNNVAFDGTNFLVVWTDGSNDSEIRGRFVSPAGSLGTEFSINASTKPSDNPVSVAFDGTNYLALWSNEISSGEWDLFGQLIGKSGSKVGGVINISTAPGQQFIPLAAFDGTYYLVTWTDTRNDANKNGVCDAGEGTCWDIYGQYVSKSGTRIGTEIPVVTDAENQFISPVVSGGGKTLVVWTNGDIIDSYIGDVYGRFLTSPTLGSLTPSVLTSAPAMPRHSQQYTATRADMRTSNRHT